MNHSSVVARVPNVYTLDAVGLFPPLIGKSLIEETHELDIFIY